MESTEFNINLDSLFKSFDQSIMLEEDVMEAAKNDEPDNEKLLKKVKTVVEKTKERLNKLFETLIKMIRDYTSKIQNYIRETVARKELKKQIAEIKRLGETNKTIEMIDVWAYEAVLIEFTKVMSTLCEQWTKEYAKSGKKYKDGIVFVNKCNKTYDSYSQKLQSIKSKKVKCRSDRAIQWIEDNIDANGNIINNLHRYMITLEDCKKSINSVSAKMVKYNEVNDYLESNDEVGKFSVIMHNTTSFIKNNGDWVLLYTLTVASTIASSLLSMSSIKDSVNGALYDDDVKTATGKDKAKMASILSKVGTGATVAGAAKQLKDKHDRRYSI